MADTDAIRPEHTTSRDRKGAKNLRPAPYGALGSLRPPPLSVPSLPADTVSLSFRQERSIRSFAEFVPCLRPSFRPSRKIAANDVAVPQPLDDLTEKRLDEIEMIGEEQAANLPRPANPASRAGMRYLHSRRTIHQLVTDRNRASAFISPRLVSTPPPPPCSTPSRPPTRPDRAARRAATLVSARDLRNPDRAGILFVGLLLVRDAAWA